MSCRKQALAMIAIAGMSASIWASEMSLEDCGRTAETFGSSRKSVERGLDF